MVWALAIKALGMLDAIETVDPVKVLGDDAGFIALNAADEVPDGLAVSEFLDLFQGLL